MPSFEYNPFTRKLDICGESAATASGVVSTHDRQHDIDSTVDHVGVVGAVEDNFISFNSNGLPKDSGYNNSDFSSFWDRAGTTLSPKTIGDDIYYGSGTISGVGDIYCNDIHTSGDSVYVGDSVLSSTYMGNLLLNSIIAGKDDYTSVSGFGNYWEERDSIRNWNCVSITSDGRRQICAVNGGLIYYSNNFGISWENIGQPARGWYNVKISSDGSVCAATVGIGGQVHVSTDYGSTWNAVGPSGILYALDMSADGSKIVTAVYSGKIYTSDDFGETWIERHVDNNWYHVAVSANGKRISAVDYGGKIHVSSDGGRTWQEKGTNNNYSYISMSDSGKFQTVTVNNGTIYISSDYGETWVSKSVITLWRSCSVSYDGKIQVAADGSGDVYISEDYGNNWEHKTTLPYGASFVAMSANGANITITCWAGKIYTSFARVYINRDVKIVGNLILGNDTISEFSTDGSMSGDSDDAIPTEKAVKAYVDDVVSTISGGSGTTDHSSLNNLDYSSSGHTGFQPAGDYLTDLEFTTYSGTLQSQIDSKSDSSHTHDDRYYTESELDESLSTKYVDIVGDVVDSPMTKEGLQLRIEEANLTDTFTPGLRPKASASSFARPTMVGDNSVSVSNASTVYIDGPPIEGSNMSILNPWSFYVDKGNVFVGGTISGTGDFYCNDLYTSGNSVNIGDSLVTSSGSGIHVLEYYGDGSHLTGIPSWYYDYGIPSSDLGSDGDYYIELDSADLYNKTTVIEYTTWNPDDRDVNVVLSGGNLITTTNDTGHNAIRAILSKSSGKWYWEVTIGVCEYNPCYTAVGIGTSNQSLSSKLGTTIYSYSYYSGDGEKYHGGSYGDNYGDTFGQGDVIGVALDMDAGKIWFSKNGVWQDSGDPAAGTGEAYSSIVGTYYPMISISYNGDSATTNFGGSTFTSECPAGFSGLISLQEITWDRLTSVSGSLNNFVVNVSGTLQDQIDDISTVYNGYGYPSVDLGDSGDLYIERPEGSIYRRYSSSKVFFNNFWNQAYSGDSSIDRSKLVVTAGSSDCACSYFGVSTGKWYWECTILNSNRWFIGVGDKDESNATSNLCVYYGFNGNVYYDSSPYAYGDTFSGDDVIGVALDMDAGKIWFSKNGVWQDSGDPAAGTGEAYSWGSVGYDVYAKADSLTGSHLVANFGQTEFSYSVPSGFYSGMGEYNNWGVISASISGTLQGQIDDFHNWYGGYSEPSTLSGIDVDYYFRELNGDIYKKINVYSEYFNPNDKQLDIVLSNNNLTVANSVADYNGVRAVEGKSSGKWYWEIYINDLALTNEATYVGIARSSASLTNFIGFDANGWGYGVGGNFINNNSQTVTGVRSYFIGDVISIALDLDNNKMWFAKNGDWQGAGSPDPSTGTDEAYDGVSGTIYPAVSLFSTDAMLTANFGVSDFVYNVPDGFSKLFSTDEWYRFWNPDGRYYTQQQIDTLSGTLHLWDREGTSLTPKNDADDIDYKYGNINGYGDIIAGGYTSADDSVLTVNGDVGLRKLNSIPTTDNDFWKLYVREYGTSYTVALDEWKSSLLEVSNPSAGWSCYFNDPYYIVLGYYSVSQNSMLARLWYTASLDSDWSYNDIHTSGRCFATDIGHDGSNYFVCARVINDDGDPFRYQCKVLYSNTLSGTWNSNTICNSDLSSFTPYSMIYDSSNNVYVIAGTTGGVGSVSCFYSSTLSGTWDSTLVDNGGSDIVAGYDLLYDGTNYVICGGTNIARSGYVSSCDIWYSTTVSGSWSTHEVEYDGINDLAAGSIVYNGSDQYVITSRDGGKIWYSSSLSSGWSGVSTGTDGWSIIYDDPYYVFVGGSNGAVVYFSDGPNVSGTWNYSKMDSVNNSCGYDIAYDDENVCFACGIDGSDGVAKVFYSTTWSGSWNSGTESSVFALDTLGNEHNIINPSDQKELTIFEPDQVDVAVPMFHVNDRIYPYGITVEALSIQISSNTSYTLSFEEWSGTPPTYLSAIENVSTTASGSYAEVENSDIDDYSVSAGNWVFVDTPSTDVSWVVAECIFRKKTS